MVLNDKKFEGELLSQLEAAGFSGLKGHKSLGGIRASIYNSSPYESVEALIEFMHDFE